MTTSSEKIVIENELFEEGWVDGLPVVLPTEQRVEKMLCSTKRNRDEIIGYVAPLMGEATVEKTAINSVMAGCKPEYFPIVLAGLEAVIDEHFNLNGIQATTHCAAPLMVVNGPIRKEIELNCGSNVFGQGFRANATIGRALRFLLMNIGGGIPGTTDKSTFGHPGKFTFCIGENEEESPWEPLHVERGFDKNTSTVTVFGAEAPHSFQDHISNTATRILTMISHSLATLGNNNIALYGGELMVVLSPEHAAIIAKEGFVKKDIKQFIYEKARLPWKLVKIVDSTNQALLPKWIDTDNPEEMIPLVEECDDIIVVLAGGPGRFSMGLPGWGGLGGLSVTKEIG